MKGVSVCQFFVRVFGSKTKNNISETLEGIHSGQSAKIGKGIFQQIIKGNLKKKRTLIMAHPWTGFEPVSPA